MSYNVTFTIYAHNRECLTSRHSFRTSIQSDMSPQTFSLFKKKIREEKKVTIMTRNSMPTPRKDV